MSQLKGGGGKKQTAPTPTNTPDNLRSEDTVEIVLGVTEGPWRGLTNGNKSVNVGDTVLQRQDGEYNFQDFDVKVYPGSAFPDPLTFKLGGESSNFQVGVATSYGIPLTRQTEHGNIDAIDIRMVVQQLYTSQETGNRPGVFDATFEFKIRYKPASATEWSEWDGAAAQQPGNGNPYVNTYQTWSPDVQYVADHYFDPSTNQTWYPSNFNAATNWYVANGGSYGGVLRITGKTTSTYVKEYRIPVQRIPEPYMIQIVRLSQDSSLTGDPKYYAEVTWESFQTIDTSPKTYPYTGFLQISGRSTDQFTSIPQFSGEGDGLILKVPTNYDPDTHTYTGVWDGNFKEAWTNDPVWILYEAIHNDRWGWSTYTPVKWSRYEAYELSQITNFKLANGQPRYTFNAYLTEAMDGREFCRYIAGSFNSVIVDDDNGNVRVLMDKDDPAVAIFGPESIVGDFEYTYTDTNTRFNDITAVFRNPAIDYNEDRRGIKDEVHIAQFGRIPFDFVSVGTTNENEAIRKASRRLVSATTETEMVNFKTNRKAQYLTPYDVILITDPYKGYGISGRFKSFSGSTVQLRDPIYLETGVTYAIDFEDPSGIITRTLTGVTTGFTSTLTLSAAVPGTVNQKAQFSLKQNGAGYGLPKPYRILDLTRNGEDDYSVMAIEINRNKFAAEDNAELVGEPRYSFPIKKEPEGPTNLKVTNLSRAAEDGTMIYEVRYDFTPPSDPYVTEHYVRYRLDDESEYTVALTEGTGGIVTLPRAGSWVFEAQSRNIWSQQSPWAAATPTPLVVDKAGGVQQGGSILSATGGLNQITVKVAYPTDQTDIRYVNVYTALSNSNGSATFVGKTDSDTFNITGLSGVQSRYVFIKFEDNLGNLGPFTSSTGALATTTTAGSNDIANGSVTAQKFAPGISPVESVSSLPLTGNFEGRMVLLSTDGKLYSYTGGSWKAVVADTSGSGIAPVTTLPTGLTTADEGRVVFLKSDDKLYRWTGTAWISATSASDIAGTLAIANIPGLDASKITSGQFTTAYIADAALTAAKFSSTIKPVEILASLPAQPQPAGRTIFLTTDSKLYRSTGSAWVSTVAASDVSGTLAATQIPGLDASKITSGSFTTAYIADAAITASKFASTLKPVEIVATLPAAPHVEGRMVFLTTDDKLYRNTGTGWISTTAAADVAGTLATANIPGLDASKITSGSFTSAYIADAAITTAKFASGLKPVEIVATLPTTGNTAGRTVFLTTDSKLYRYNGTAFVKNVDGADITANSITAGQIQAGAITATEIAANAITASKLNIGDRTNLFPDPNMGDNSSYEVVTAGATFGPAGGWGAGTYSRVITVGAALKDIQSAAFAVEPSKPYFFSIKARADTATNAQAGVYVAWYSDYAASALLAYGTVVNTTSASEAPYSVTLTAPNNAVRARILFRRAPVGANTSDVRFTEPVVRRAANGELIVDGSIIAGKVAANAIVASNIVGGTITGDKIAGTTITAANIAANTITAGQIAAGTITATQIAANTITAAKLVLVDPQNFVPNAVPDPSGEPVVTGTYLQVVTQATDANMPAGAPFPYSFKISGRDHRPFPNMTRIPARVGDKFYVSAWAAVAPGGTARFNLYMYSSTIATGGSPGAIEPVAGKNANVAGWTKVEGVFTVPAGQDGKYLEPFLQVDHAAGAGTVWYVTDWQFRRQSGAELIVDGSIVAGKIAANAVTASSILAGSITGDRLAANTITAGQIAAGTITADRIASNTITAGQIAAGTIVGDKIAANAITSSHILTGSITAVKITVADFSNVADNGFSTGNLDSWLVSDNGGSFNYYKESSGNWWTLQSRGRDMANSKPIPVQPGEKYYFEAWVYNTNSDPSFNANIYARAFSGVDGTGTVNGSHVVGTGARHSWTKMSNIWTVPDGVYSVGMILQADRGGGQGTDIFWHSPVMRRAYGSELIVDGSITADKILTGSITAAKIATGTITATQIAGGTITGDRIAGNTITAGNMSVANLAAINANLGTVTAGVLQSPSYDTVFDLNNQRLTFAKAGYSFRQGIGLGSEVIMWYGYNATPWGSETRANSIWCFGTDGKVYYGGNQLTTPAAEQGFVLGGTASPTLLGFNVYNTTAFVSLSGPAAIGNVTYRWERMGGLAATLTNTESATVGVNIGSAQDGVVQLRVSVSDDERTKSREVRLRFRTNF